MNLSPHFTLSEFEFTTKDLPNHAPPEAIRNMQALCTLVLETIRAAWGGLPVHVSSGYRSQAVNVAVNGSPRSQHMLGQAADVVPPVSVGTIEDAMRIAVAVMREKNLPVGQIIVYPAADTPFIHISIDTGKPRRQCLRSKAAGGSGGPYVAWP